MPSNDVLVDRELKAARERESDYRTRLARHRSLSLRLRAHAALLRDALRDSLDGWNMMSRLLADVARLSSQALEIPRTSIWLFDENRDEPGLPLPAARRARRPRGWCCRSPAARATSARSAPPSWARSPSTTPGRDARTADLRDYLRTYNVGAMLDIPILGPGHLHGVVCHEHEGGPRALAGRGDRLRHRRGRHGGAGAGGGAPHRRRARGARLGGEVPEPGRDAAGDGLFISGAHRAARVPEPAHSGAGRPGRRALPGRGRHRATGCRRSSPRTASRCGGACRGTSPRASSAS